jgi:hypothetical protein
MTRLLERWGYGAVLIAAIRYFDGPVHPRTSIALRVPIL